MTNSSIHQVSSDISCGDYQCCFCGALIESDLQPIVLLLEGDAVQALSAHGQCLKRRLDSSVPYLTPGEVSE